MERKKEGGDSDMKKAFKIFFIMFVIEIVLIAILDAMAQVRKISSLIFLCFKQSAPVCEDRSICFMGFMVQ